MKPLKRWISGLLAMSFVLGLVPFNAKAYSNFADFLNIGEPEIVPFTQSRTGNFSRNYTLTGNGAADMVAIAMAQEGRSGSDFGYTEEWCADFVCDCAILAGQGDAIPQYGGVDGLYTRIKTAGGTITTSNPQPGDICFLDWENDGDMDHVEIVYYISGSDVYTIGGNSGSGKTRYTRQVVKHEPIARTSIAAILRPNYWHTAPPAVATLTIDKTEFLIGEEFTLTLSSDVSCNYYLSIIDADSGEVIIGEGAESTYKNSFLKAGHYVAWMSAYHTPGVGVDSNFVDFWVFGPPPTTATFSADKTTLALGETVTLTTSTDAYYVRIWMSMFLYNEQNDGTEVYGGEVPYNYRFTPTEEGVYTGHVSTWTHEGTAHSDWVTFHVGQYTVKYDANGGDEAPAAQMKYYGKDITLTTVEPIRENYEFLGWATSPESAVAEYKPGDTFKRNADTILYAVWANACANGHQYESVITQPTCTDKGYTTNTCTICGDSYLTDYVDALGHDMGEWYTEIATTCTEDGIERRDCARCDYAETQVIAANGHIFFGSWFVRYPATCTENGLEQRNCSYCDYSEIRVIAATGHSFGDWFVNRAATCTKDGENRRNCQNCSHYETEVIPATGHDHQAVVTAPTCIEQGYTTYICHCGDTYISDYTAVLGHDWDNGIVIIEPTEERKGEKLYTCQRCAETEVEILPELPHEHRYEAVVTDPTCTENGYTTHTCRCGDSYVDTWVDALGHDMGKWSVETAPTCTKDGTERRDCSRCDHAETRTIAAVGHTFGDWFVNRTATCTKDGEVRRNCRNCSHYETAVIPATGHDYQAVVTAPSCAEQGYTTYTCHCGDSYISDYTAALGHDMGKWIVETVPTCTKEGSERRDCSRCDHSETQVIEATGHSHEAVVTEPTCTETGFTTYTCHCGDSYVTDYTDPLGHSFTSYVSDGNATCTQDGTKTAVCDRCDATDTQIDVGSAHGHDFSEWTVVEEPTQTSDGLESRYCYNCGLEETRVISSLENPFTDVPEGSFYHAPVLWAVENGITNGTTATTFGPDDQCMRAHVVTFLWRAAGSPEPESNHNPFVDVKETDFYYKAVLWAVEKGITNGLDATHFGPLTYCNRAQVVTFLWRAQGQPEPSGSDMPFTDVSSGAWYEAPVRWAVANGITNGMSATSFGINVICNRAQIVTFLYRTYN